MNHLYWPSTTPGRVVAIIVYGCAVAAALGVAGLLSGLAKSSLILPLTAAVHRALGDDGVQALATIFIVTMVGLLLYGLSNRIRA